MIGDKMPFQQKWGRAWYVANVYPAVHEAMSAILSQADESFAKPIRIGALNELIRTRLAAPHMEATDSGFTRLTVRAAALVEE